MKNRNESTSRIRWLPLVLIAGAVVLLSGCGMHQRRADIDSVGEAPMDAYYLEQCATCGGRLGAAGEAVSGVFDGREMRFCSRRCEDGFGRNLTASMARIDAIMAADQRPLYPTKTSIVSGRPLGAKAREFIWGNRLFIVADDNERRAVQSNPARWMMVLNARAVEAQRSSYAMQNKCPVQGDILSSDAKIDFVIAGRMIRVCCGRCERVVRARPQQFLPMVDFANREAHSLEQMNGQPD